MILALREGERTPGRLCRGLRRGPHWRLHRRPSQGATQDAVLCRRLRGRLLREAVREAAQEAARLP